MKKFNLSTIQGKNIVIDISELISHEVIYINATELAKQFGKDRRRLNDFLKSKTFLEYENAIFKVLENSHFKVRKNRTLELVKIEKGKYGGTYLHSDLVIVFLRWLNVDFAVKCDMYIKQQIQQIHNEKITANATAKANRANSEWIKTRETSTQTRNTLTDAIKTFCEYAELQRETKYKNNKCPYYIKLTSLVYKALNIKKPKGTYILRDVFSGAIVEKIEYLEDMLTNLLKSHIEQETEYHEAFKNIKDMIAYEVMLLDEVA
jgi:hypothetical protein